MANQKKLQPPDTHASRKQLLLPRRAAATSELTQPLHSMCT